PAPDLWPPIPLSAARFSPAETLSYQYREQKAPNGEIVPGILPKGATVRRFTPFFNIYGLIALVGGALYSAWLLWRKEIAPYRVIGNILIAAGAFVIASASTMVRLGLGRSL